MGLGLALVPATIVAVQGVPPQRGRLASGLLNTSRLLGGALGLAVLTTIAEPHTHAAILRRRSAAQALTDGYGLAVLVGAVRLRRWCGRRRGPAARGDPGPAGQSPPERGLQPALSDRLAFVAPWRGGRAVECDGLENR